MFHKIHNCLYVWMCIRFVFLHSFFLCFWAALSWLCSHWRSCLEMGDGHWAISSTFFPQYFFERSQVIASSGGMVMISHFPIPAKCCCTTTVPAPLWKEENPDWEHRSASPVTHSKFESRVTWSNPYYSFLKNFSSFTGTHAILGRTHLSRILRLKS